MIKTLPSLSNSGWITDPKMMLSTILSYILTSEKSQSVIYADKVTSLAYIVAKFQNDQNEMAAQTESYLNSIYQKYFPIANVTVTYDTAVNGKYNLFISVDVTTNGNSYDLAVVVTVNENGVLSNIINVLNS